MSAGQIIRLIPLSPEWLATSGFYAQAAFPVGNLASPQPKVVLEVPGNATGATVQYGIVIDLQADVPFDQIGLLYHNVTDPGILWNASATTSAVGLAGLNSGVNALFAPTVLTVPPRSTLARLHALKAFGAVVRRYIVIILTLPAGSSNFSIGLAIVGQTLPFNATFNFELGAGRKIDDLSDVRPLPGGELGIWRKARVPIFRATWSQLTDAELLNVWSLIGEVGASAPLIVVEDPDGRDGLIERTHYGVLDGAPDFYARQQVDKSSIEIKIREWL